MALKPMNPLPRLRSADPQAILEWSNSLIQALELQIRVMTAQATPQFAITSATKLRTLDSSTATLTQTAECLATLILDMQSIQIVP